MYVPYNMGIPFAVIYFRKKCTCTQGHKFIAILCIIMKNQKLQLPVVMSIVVDIYEEILYNYNGLSRFMN